MHNLGDLLKVLMDSEIDFVLVGGFASVVYGSSMVTRDLDICALNPKLFHAYYRTVLKGLASGTNELTHDVRKQAFEEINKRLQTIKESGTLDNSGVIRVDDLLKRVPTSSQPTKL